MLNRVKSLVPKKWRQGYHFLLAWSAVILYGFPSKKLRVIGVTGTNGKSSTVQIIGQLLMSLGERVGWTTTASFRVGEKEWVNDKKMTMPGRFFIQRFLSRAVKSGCQYAILETTSEGAAQYRHKVCRSYSGWYWSNCQRLGPSSKNRERFFSRCHRRARLLLMPSLRGQACQVLQLPGPTSIVCAQWG